MMQQREKLIDILVKNWADGMTMGECADMLLANGVIVPPCKVGDTLYAVRYWSTRKQIYSFVAPDIAWIIEHINDFDKTIFLTREEAEKALKERVKQ